MVGDAGQIVKMQGASQLTLSSGTSQNLRAISINPQSGAALIVGNAGTMIHLEEGEDPTRINVSTIENLRTAAWNPHGSTALIAGNHGILLKYSNLQVEAIDGGIANFRRVSWRPNRSQALVTSNCFAEDFIPSPNLFAFEPEENTLIPLNEGRADLIGVDWNPDGVSALVVGYDVIWHNGFIGTFDGVSLFPIEFSNKRVYPVAVSWNRSGEMAAIVTATAQLGVTKGTIHLWDRRSLTTIFTSSEFFFSSVTWNDDGDELAALASSATRTFNC